MSEKSRIPNAVTCARFILLIPFVWLVREGSQTHYAAALVVLVVATLTDVFDGYLARKLNSVSDFGSLLDVTADRMLAVTSVTILMGIGAANFYLGLAVICREIAAESIRSLGVRSNSLLPHNLFGRIKFIAIVSAMASGLLALAGNISSASGRQITNALLAIALLSGVSSVLVMQRSVRGGGNGNQR